jgi:hypothetical protein
MMPHTTAANIGIFFGLTGRVIPTSSACSSGSQGIGYAYESIKYGMIDDDAGRRRRRILPLGSVCVRLALRRQPPQRCAGENATPIRHLAATAW